MATIVRSKDLSITNLAIPKLYIPLAAETKDLLAAMTVQPSSAIRSLINKTIADSKDALLWPKFRSVHAFGLPTQQAAFLDWKLPSRAAPIITGEIAYNARGNLVPDGSTGFLDMGFSANSLGLTVNNAGASCKFGPGTGPLFGTTSSSGNLFHASVSSGNALTSRLNQTAAQDGIALPSNQGHLTITRASADAYSRYHDGLSVTAAPSASSAIATNNFALFRQGNAYGTHGISMFVTHTALSSADNAALFQIMTTFVERIATI
ncbi:hypothetical protein [Methylobacterium sp. Leaf106]|uniref:hypothetical protein n=1 Tax=Methylobacterium sp. Leaf106 TaxID=1736255 RepID=UPI0006F5D948|nr:hypothetical protein [Methylobacterium sp. Leaf106]KQP52993.1 hypothetical protein ASF34_01070 [Methylobacterium sp. Leaf106]